MVATIYTRGFRESESPSSILPDDRTGNSSCRESFGPATPGWQQLMFKPAQALN